MNSWQAFSTFIGGIATLAIFSFLIKENWFYRFFEHVFIGIASGFGIIVGVKEFLWPKLIMPMMGLDIDIYPDGTLSKEWDWRLLLYLIPIVFGLLYYFIYSKRYFWLAKLVIGFSLGMSGGIAFKGFFNEMLPQLTKSFKPLLVFHDGAFNLGLSISNCIFVFTLLAVMYYFFFSFKVDSKVMNKFGASGRWLMMICFGAFFGSTVMARMALLVERLQFLTNDWWTVVKQLL